MKKKVYFLAKVNEGVNPEHLRDRIINEIVPVVHANVVPDSSFRNIFVIAEADMTIAEGDGVLSEIVSSVKAISDIHSTYILSLPD